MIDSIPLASGGEHSVLNVALLFGLIVLGGTFGARLFQRLRIPQVVGCIFVGILLGDVLGVITPHRLEAFEPFTVVALGIIGFMIGAELRADMLKKYGRQFFIILFSEGLGAFLLVTLATAIAGWFVMPAMVPDVAGLERVALSLAMGLMLGAIASATAPAATVNVLWEYKTKGPLTTAVLAMVAFDDALALLLYRGAATGAQALIGTGHETVLHSVLVLLAEVFGAVALGCLAGVMLYFLLKLTRAEDKILDFTLGALLLVVGISMIPRIDPILPAMTLGVTVANIMPRQSKTVFKLVETFAPPIYISFFVLAGAHMEFGRITPWMLAIILIYVVFRAAGKIAGVQLGGAVAKAPAVVRNYLGLCLMPQAGVAIGLAILAGRQFNGEIGHTIILIIMTSTFALELIGPMLVKVGVKRAGEIGLNITEADLIESYRVADVMQPDVPTIDQGMLLSDILAVVSGTEGAYYAVVDGNRNLLGAITLEGIRKTFATQEINDWLVALDIMEPIEGRLTPEMPLAEALEQTALLNAEHMPVVAADDGTFLGVFGERHVRRMLSAEVLLRQRKAEGVASA